MRLHPSLVGFAAPALLIIGGCAVSSVAPAVTPAMVAHAGGTSEATLKEGRQIFANACTACHSPDPVSRHSLAKWNEIVETMAPRAKLDAARKAALLAYLRGADAVMRADAGRPASAPN